MRNAAVLVGGLLLAGCGGKHDATTVAVNRTEFATSKHLTVKTLAVGPRQAIPIEFTANGAGTMPKISWAGVPPETKEVELLIEDPDAPGDVPYVHLLVEGIDPSQTEYPGKTGTFAENTAGKKGYTPPNPPPGLGHHYHFEVLAVDVPLGAKPMNRDDLFHKMTKHVIASGEVVGTFSG